MSGDNGSKFDQIFGNSNRPENPDDYFVTHRAELSNALKNKFGEEGAIELESTIRTIEFALLGLLADHRIPQDSSLPQTLRDLGNNLYPAPNVQPDNAITALEAANSMAAIEPLAEFKPGAQKGVDGLHRRYGVTPKP